MRFTLHPCVRRCLLAVALAVVAGSCGSERYDRTLRIAHDTAPLTLDPHHHNDSATWSLQSNLYDGLVRFDDEMRLEPALAEHWEQVDATHLRLALRRGVQFAGGGELQAADVAASLERARSDPASKIRYHLLGVREVRALDGLTVEIETDRPTPTLLNRLALVFIVPREDARRAEIEVPNGTGPYRFGAATPGGGIRLEAWNSWRGMPEIRRVELSPLAGGAAIARQLFAGQLDVVRLLPEEVLGELRRVPGVRAVAQPRLYVQMLALNPGAANGRTAEALADSRVRRALLAGCDRERWVREVFRGAGAVASQCVHPVVFGYEPELQPVPFEPSEARRLLAEAGFAAGLDLTLEYADTQRDMVMALVDDLAKVGVAVRAIEVKWPDLLQRARAGESELTVFAWACTTGDAGDFLNACAHSPSSEAGLGGENYGGYADRATDALIEAADRELDPHRRLALLYQAQRRLIETGRVLPLTLRSGYLGVSDRVDVRVRHDQWLWVAGFRWKRPA